MLNVVLLAHRRHESPVLLQGFECRVSFSKYLQEFSLHAPHHLRLIKSNLLYMTKRLASSRFLADYPPQISQVTSNSVPLAFWRLEDFDGVNLALMSEARSRYISSGDR